MAPVLSFGGAFNYFLDLSAEAAASGTPLLGASRHRLEGTAAKQKRDIVLYLTTASLSLAFMTAIAAHIIRAALSRPPGTGLDTMLQCRAALVPAGLAAYLCYLALHATRLQLLFARMS